MDRIKEYQIYTSIDNLTSLLEDAHSQKIIEPLTRVHRVRRDKLRKTLRRLKAGEIR